jgi:ribonuclease Z
VAPQFDAGRATVLRLLEAGVQPTDLDAVFITHVHSDHVVDLADVAMTRWVQQPLGATGPLVVVAPDGAPTRFVRRMLEPLDDDLALRMAHVGADPIETDLRPFEATQEPSVVWTDAEGSVRVLAVAVHHEPVPDAVAYRVETPDGVVVISGDTRVCEEVERLAVGADLLVHEACRTTAMAPVIEGTIFETIFSYHADTVELGAMATRAGVPHVVLTHLIPPPEGPEDEEAFGVDLRRGGYDGEITVGRDLATVVVGAR